MYFYHNISIHQWHILERNQLQLLGKRGSLNCHHGWLKAVRVWESDLHQSKEATKTKT